MRRIFSMVMAAAAAGAVVTRALSEEGSVEQRFRDPRDGRLGPIATLRFPSAQAEEARVMSLLVRLREVGAGGVLVSLHLADATAWRLLGKIADFCQQADLEMGVCDGPMSADDAAAWPLARKLVWSSRALSREGGGATNLPPETASAADYRLISLVAVPDGGPVLSHQVVDLSQAVKLGDGPWRELRFGSVPAELALIDPFDEAGVNSHMNRALVALQGGLRTSYGATLTWYQCEGLPRDARVWPSDMGRLFLKRSGLSLARSLPALAGVPVGGPEMAEQVRRLMETTVCEAWRERFAMSVRDLVQESGLEAGMRVDQMPVEPEEASLYFRRPAVSVARGAAAHEFNARAAGAARSCARRTIVGRLPLESVQSTPDAALLAFPFKHEVDGLLADGATRLLFDAGCATWSDDARYGVLRAACSYVRRCHVLLQHGEPVADFLFWGDALPPALLPYSSDRTCKKQVETASVRGGALRFPSERSYRALVVAPSVLRDADAEGLLRQLASKGLALWVADDEAPESRPLIDAAVAGDRRFAQRFPSAAVSGLLPDFESVRASDGPQLRFLHRRTQREDVYLVVNACAVGGAVSPVFRDVGRGVAEKWDPLEGDVSVLQESRRLADGRLAVSMYVGPHDACFVVFDR